ncbi:MAG TPA: glycosyl hydrolase family 28 protein [Bacteroidales bacterium]|nr:glycosyl hydrolase family 28 protein [Bacteroidales bacterium]
MTKIKILTLALLSACMMLSAKDYKASLFGVKSDGATLNTRSIQTAIDYISANGGGRLVFYVGRYLTGTIQLKSNVTIQLEEGAILVGTTSVYDYFGIDGVRAIILADKQENTGISGKGVIEGQGVLLMNNIKTQIQKGYLKETPAQASPMLVYMKDCNNVTIEQINMWDACGDIQSYKGCKKININKISIKSSLSAESKGILLADCNDVTLADIYFNTSGPELIYDRTSKNVSVVNCKNENGKAIRAK